MNKLALKITLLFMGIYAILATFGSLFLVSWGHTNWYKEVMVFALAFPIAWNKLIADVSLFFLPLNILFWSTVVYFCALLIIKMRLRFKERL